MILTLMYVFGIVHVLFLGTSILQTEQDSVYREKRFTYLEFDFAGKPVLSEQVLLDWSPPFGTFELLKSKEILKELELDPKQDKQLESLLNQFEEWRAEIGKKQRLGKPASKEEFDKKSLELKNEIDSLFLPFQDERIEELYWQVTMRKFGVDPLLDEWLRRSERKLTDEQRRAIYRIINQMAQEWADDVKKRCADMLSEFGNSIPKQFQKEFSARVAANSDYESLDMLDLASKRFLERLKSVKEKRERDHKIEFRLTQTQYHSLEADGQWISHSRKVPFAGALLDWIVDPEKSQLLFLELSEFQLEQLSNLTREIRAKNKEKNEAVNEMYDNGVEERRIRDFLDRNSQEVDDFAKHQFFDEILLPHQHDALVERLELLDAAKDGPFALSTALEKISDEHRNQFIESTEKLRNSILEIHGRSSDFERSSLAKLKQIDESMATQLQDMIGRKPKHLGFCWLLFMKTYRVKSR